MYRSTAMLPAYLYSDFPDPVRLPNILLCPPIHTCLHLGSLQFNLPYRCSNRIHAVNSNSRINRNSYYRDPIDCSDRGSPAIIHFDTCMPIACGSMHMPDRCTVCTGTVVLVYCTVLSFLYSYRYPGTVADRMFLSCLSV